MGQIQVNKVLISKSTNKKWGKNKLPNACSHTEKEKLADVIKFVIEEAQEAAKASADASDLSEC
ncbi:hypothetical protein [Vibrio penaeicida]|uniref:hypothetical protein n=1 Tax=Vibrio penaeicida TaxID=104609 RepID=UPI000CEA15B9|nr:hypothetical protein [Vibrio penaeicida]